MKCYKILLLSRFLIIIKTKYAFMKIQNLPILKLVKYFGSVMNLFHIEDHHHVSTYQTRRFSTKAKHIGGAGGGRKEKENKYQT